nr:immunoglobulin heavy chain junction region [Macaca mulatta]MOW18959.1 immunoglobulin heavy chain junction region [Macaca mulatta]MOW19019.1 immunoglobulin heavy chain junction region [Macaca mulatta]MOW19393.1 immunoglobulin heavy chain junction region [Macaca mulatta]MOW19477.1 immunoglobulin heavy chain junction region [Macaca mulatta]
CARDYSSSVDYW